MLVLVRVTAVFNSASSESDEVSTNTLTAGTFRHTTCVSVLCVYLSPAPSGAPGTLSNTSVESRSLTVVWGTVPCPDQRGPITGYRLLYNSVMVVITGEENRQHVLTGLTPFTSYSVQVLVSMLQVLDHTVIQHSLWRHCRMVSDVDYT